MGYQPVVGRREEDKQGGLEVHVRELLSEQWSRGVPMSLCLSDLPPRRLWLESGQPVSQGFLQPGCQPSSEPTADT